MTFPTSSIFFVLFFTQRLNNFQDNHVATGKILLDHTNKNIMYFVSNTSE